MLISFFPDHRVYLKINNFIMNSDYYISLIYKELKGIISPEETKDLRTWEMQSTENQSIAEEIKQVWIESEQYELPFELDHEADFAKMKSTIPVSNSPAKVVPMRPRRLWLQGIAAAVIVLLELGVTSNGKCPTLVILGGVFINSACANKKVNR